MQYNNLPQSAFLRERDVLRAYLPVSKSTLWVMVSRGDFPRPIKLSAGITVWRLTDIEAWLNGHGGQSHA